MGTKHYKQVAFVLAQVPRFLWPVAVPAYVLSLYARKWIKKMLGRNGD